MYDDYRPRHEDEERWARLDDRAPLQTETLPMTPAMRACLRSGLLSRAIQPFLTCAVAAVIIVGWFLPKDAGTTTTVIVGAFALLGTAGYVAWAHIQTLRDLRDGTFRRYSGAWTVAVDRDGPYVELPDGSQYRLPEYRHFQAHDVGGGQVDFTPRAGVVFEIRDALGNVLVRDSKYRP
ncbi:MAG TPA: hypothetical protein VJ890_03680 [Vineibacter sp.]|nr:hypothetical protein [Vineibacter sp.]